MIVSLCLLTALSTPFQRPDSTARPSYRIVATLDQTERYLNAKVVLQIPRSAFGAADSVRLALGGPGSRRLLLSAVPMLGDVGAPDWIAPDSAEVAFRLGSEPVVSLSFEYRVAIDSSGRRQLGYNLFGAIDAGSAWYPTLLSLPDSLRRFSDFDVSLELPAGITLLTSGAAHDSMVQSSRIRRQYREEHLEGFALAFGRDYLIRSHAARGGLVHALSPAADTLIWDRVAFETARAMGWYEDAYGFFPVKTIAIVPGSQNSRGGFPMPNMFMIHRGDLSPAFVRWISAHELAHYYWGLYVLSSAERLDWLMLGLGIWTDSWYLAHIAGTPLAAQWRSPDGDNSFEDFAVAQIASYDQRLDLPESEGDALDYDYNTYVRHGKGAVGLYLLSLRLGPERFVAFQRALLREFRYRPLSPAIFATRLEAAGVTDASGFLRAWVRPDARLDFAIRAVRPDAARPGTYWIQVERTGTIASPITLEARASNGATVRVELRGEASSDSVAVTLPGAPWSLGLDPDGLLPLWSGSNVEMQRLYLRAMGAAGPAEVFLRLAEAHLAHDQDPVVAALVVERHFELGRFAEIQRLARQQRFVTRCTGRITCLAALQVARALARVGAVKEAAELLREIQTAMGALGLGSSRRLATARTEISPSP